MRSFHFKLAVTGFALASLLTPTLAVAGDLASSVNLFFIKRKLNTNEVHYDARVDRGKCVWMKPEVDAYWRNLEVNPTNTSNIQFYEGGAYGHKVARSSDTEITITLSAVPTKHITARLSRTQTGGCSVSSTIDINGKPAEFASVYVHHSDGVWPTVYSIDILGTLGGQRVYERIKKSAEAETQPPDASRWKSGANKMGRQ